MVLKRSYTTFRSLMTDEYYTTFRSLMTDEYYTSILSDMKTDVTQVFIRHQTDAVMQRRIGTDRRIALLLARPHIEVGKKEPVAAS